MNQVIKGFTLIEVIIAISVLAIGIVGVLYMFPMGIQIARSSWMSTIATELAQIKMEESLSKSYDDILCDGIRTPPCKESKARVSEDPQTPFYNYWREMELNYVDPVANLATTTSDLGIKKIIVTVSWGTPIKEIEVNTLVAKR